VPIPTVTLDELIEPEWGNAVSAAVAALESADSAIQAILGAIQANDWVTTARIANGAVTEAKLASNSVTAAKIAAGQVTEAKIASGAVTTAKIANGDVTNAKLASGIDAGKLTTGTLPAARIGSNAITTARIANNAVNNDKLANAESDLVFDVRFWRISNVVWCAINNCTGIFGGDIIDTPFRPAGNRTFMIHRHSDGAHRAVTAQANGQMSIDGSDGTWSGYAFWTAAS